MTNYIRTENEALTYENTGKACLDLFSKIGAMRGDFRTTILKEFENAFNENPRLATRIAYWARAAREGSGERNTFYMILDEIAKCSPAFVSDNARTLAELGYYKDLLRYFNIPGVVSAFAQAVREKDRLACKWAPRKGKNAKLIRDELGFTNRDYRKWLKKYSETVEQQMSSQEWGGVKYSSVPGAALRRYKDAFTRKDYERFEEWKDDKNSKASVSASYPHEVMKVAGDDDKLAQKLWDNLPNFIEGDESILPMIDVSGSMHGFPMEVAVALGLYLSERNNSDFKNRFLSFSSNPQIIKVDESMTLSEKIYEIMQTDWGMSTDFQKAYELILDLATTYNVDKNSMPSMLLVLSDMQFDDSQDSYWGGDKVNTPHFDQIKKSFEKAGYDMPKLVFWNLRASFGVPAEHDTDGVAMVSGFSPKIMTAILNTEDFNPMMIMEEALTPIVLDYTNLNKELDIDYQREI